MTIGAADAAVDLTTVSGTALNSVTVTADVTFTGTLDETVATAVVATKTLTAAAAVVNGKTITGAGAVEVTALDATPGAVLSGITVSGAKTAAVSDDVIFTGNLGSFTTTVAEAKTLTATAAVVDGKTISGAGAVEVTALDATPGADLSSITVAGAKTAAVSDDVNFTGKLGSFTATVADDKTLTAAAAVVDGKTINGDGTVAVTALHATLNADLSGIDAATTTAAFGGDGTFTGTLGGAVVTVGDGFTMTAAATKVAGQTINKAATGKLAVTIGAADAAVDLTTVSGTALNSVTVTADVTFTGTLDETVATAVVATKTLTATAAVVNGKTITGDGTVAVTALHATLNADLSGIDAATTTAAFGGDGTFTGTLGGAVVTVGDGFTMTAAATKVAGQTINKAATGKLAVTIGAADAEVNLTTINGTALDSVTVTGDVTFTGTLDDALTTVVAATKMLTASAAVVDGKTISGDGSVAVTALENSVSANLSLLTAETVTAAVNVANASLEFEGDLGAASVSISGTAGGVFDVTQAQMSAGAQFTVGTDTVLRIEGADISGRTVNGQGAVQIVDFVSTTDLQNVLAGGATATLVSGFSGLFAESNSNWSISQGPEGRNGSVVFAGNTLTLTATQGEGASQAGTVSAIIQEFAAVGGTVVVNYVFDKQGDGERFVYRNTSGDDISMTQSGSGTLTLNAESLWFLVYDDDGTPQSSTLTLSNFVYMTAGGAPGLASVEAIVAAGGVDITNGNVGAVTTYTVENARSLALTAQQADGKVINGAGEVMVTALEGASAAGLSALAVGLDVTVELESTGGVALSSNLSTVDTLNITGTGTVTSTATLNADLTIDVGVDSTLSLTAAAAQSVAAINGAGTVAVTALHATLDANLGGIDTAIKTAAFGGNGAFTGTLDGAVVTVGDGFTMTAAATKVAGETVNKTGTGALAVTIGTVDAAVNVDNIRGNALSSVTVTESVVFTGTLDGATYGTAVATKVATDKTLTATGAILTGKTVTGAGSVTVTALGATTNLSGVTPVSGVTVDMAATSVVMTTGSLGATGLEVVSTGGAATLDLSATAGDMDATRLTVWDGVTLVVTATQAAQGAMSARGDANTSKFVIVVENGNDLSGGVVVPARYDLKLAGLDSSVTATADQLVDAGDVMESAAGTKTVNVVGALTGYTIDAVIDTLVLANATNSVTLGTVAQNVTAGTGADSVTMITGATGTIALSTGANVINVANALNISGATISGTYNLNLVGEATAVTVAAAHLTGAADVIETAAGDKKVKVFGALTGYTIDGVIDTLVLADATNSVTLGAVAQSVIGGTGADTVTMIDDAAGTIALGTGANVVNVADTLNIANATISDTYVLNLVGTDTVVAVSAAQLTDAADVIETADGIKTVTVADALTNYTIHGVIDTLWLLFNGSNSVTLGAAGQNVTGGMGDDTIRTGALTIVSGVLNGGTGDVDVVLVEANATLSATLTAIDEVKLATDVSITTTIANNALIADEADGTNTVTLSDADSATGASSVEAYVLAEGAQTFTLGLGDQAVQTSSLDDVANDEVTVNTAGFTTVTSALTKGAGDDTLRLVVATNATNISGATTVDVNAITLVSNVDATMTIAQHNKIDTATDDNTVLLSDAGTVTANAAVEKYALSGVGANTITVNANKLSVNIDGWAGNDTVVVGALTVTGTYALGAGANSVSLSQNASIAGASISAVDGSYGLTLSTDRVAGLADDELGSQVTMTVAQHNSAASITAAGTADQITLSTAGAVTGNAAVESYVLANGDQTFKLGADAQNVTTGTGAVVINTDTRTTVSGTFDGDAATSLTVVVGVNSDISEAVIKGTTGVQDAGYSLTIDGRTMVTMTVAQSALIGSAANDNTVLLSDAGTVTANAAVEKYALSGVGANTITVNANKLSVNIDGWAGNDTVVVGALTVTGTYALGAGANSVSLSQNASIAGANISAVDGIFGLTLSTDRDQAVEGSDNLGSQVTMTVAQHDSATQFTAEGTADQITLSNAGEITGHSAVESYVLANLANNDFTLGATGQDVTGSAGFADTVRTGSMTNLSGTSLALGDSGTDLLVVTTTGTNLSGINSGAATTAETLNISTIAAVSMTVVQHNALTTITATGTVEDDDAETITLTDAGAVTGNAAVEAYELADAADNDFTLGATGQDVTGSAANADTVRTGAIINLDGTILDLGGGTDVLVISTTSTDISGATTTQVEQIHLDTGVSATMTVAQNAKIVAMSAVGANTVTLSNVSTKDEFGKHTRGNAGVEAYVLADVANNDFTLGATGQDVTGSSAHADVVRTGMLTDLTNTVLALGDTETDVLLVQTTGANLSGINSGAATTAEALEMNSVNASMTATQHNAFTAVNATGTETITLSGAGDVMADADVETYVLGDTGRTITLAANSAQTITGGAGADVLAVNGTTYSGAVGAVEAITLTTGGDIKGANNGAVTGATSATISGSVQMTVAQHEALTMTDGDGAESAETITLSGTGNATGKTVVESYVLANGDQIFTLGADAQNVTTGTGEVVINTGTHTTVSGIFEGRAATSLTVVVGANNSNISDAVIVGAAQVQNYSLTIDERTAVTMTVAQNARIVSAVGNNNTVTLSGAGNVTANADVEAYVLGDTARTITLAPNSAQTITGSAGADVLAVNGTTYTGTVSAVEAITLTTGGDIKGANGGSVTGATTATIAGAVQMTVAQHQAMTLVDGDGGASAETITLSGAERFVMADADVETYVLGTEGREIQLSDDSAQTITGGEGNDVLSVRGWSYTGTVSHVETVWIRNGGDITGANGGEATGARAVVVHDSVRMTAAQHEGFTFLFEALTNSDQITLSGAGNVTANAGVETYVLGAEGRTIMLTANSAQTITGGVGPDVLAVNGTTYTGTVSAVESITLSTGGDIKGANLTGATTVTMSGSVQMTVAQHEALTIEDGDDALSSEKITLSGAGDATGKLAVESYVLANGNQIFTLGAAGQNVTTSGGTVTIDSNDLAALTGVINGTTGTVTLQVTTDASVAASTLTAVVIDLDSDVNLTLGYGQHGLLGTGSGTNIVTLTGAAADLTGNATIESYVLASGDQTFTLGADAQNVTTGTGEVVINTGERTTVSGIFDGRAATSLTVVVGANNSNISDAVIVGAAEVQNYSLTIDERTAVTMTVAQNARIVSAAGNNNTVTLSGAGNVTANAAVEKYVLSGAGANTITVNTHKLAVIIDGGAGSDTVEVGGLTVTGTYALGEGDNTVSLSQNASIAGASITAVAGTYGLTLSTDSVAGGADDNLGSQVTMNVAQHNSAASITAAGTADQITLSNAATATGNAAVERYVLANGDQTFTLGAESQSVTGGTGNDTIHTGSLIGLFTGTLNGGTGTNTFVAADNLDITGASVSNFQTFQTASGKKLTVNAQDVSGRSVVGAGTLNIVETMLLASTDLTGVGTGLMFNNAYGALTLGSGVTLTIFQGQMLSMTGILDGGNTANVVVTGVSDGLDDLSEINVLGTVTAQLADAAVTIATGNNANFAGVTTFEVQNGRLFTLDAALALGKSITGGGSVALRALNAAAAADLSTITVTGAKTVAVAADVTFTGNLGAFTTTVTEPARLTATAVQLAGKTISGAGAVAVTELDEAPEANLSTITVAGAKTAAVAADVTFTGDLGGFTTTVATGARLTATAALLAGKTINGDGAVAVTALNATPAANLSTITVTGAKTAAVAESVTFTGNLGGFTTTVASGATLTATAAVVTGKTINGDGGLTVTDGTLTVADADVFANALAVTVTATLEAGNLDSFATLAETGNAYTITVNDDDGAAVAATALSTLGGKTTGPVTVTGAVAISGTAAEVTAALVTAATKVTASTATVTVSDAGATALTATALSAIGGATAGTVTVSNAVAISGTAAQVTAALVTADTKVVAAIAAVTLNDANTTALTAAALSAMGAATAGTVTVTHAVAISGTAAEVTAALVTADTKVVASLAAVTISDATAAPITAAALSAIGGETSGAVTVSNAVAISGTVAEVTAALVTDATKVTAATAAVTISDATATSLTAADLRAIGGATTGTVTVSNAVAISGTAAEVTAALVTAATKVTASMATVTLSDAGATALTAAALSAIGGATSGTVTVSNAVAITGTAAQVTAALVTESTKVVAAAATVTLSDANTTALTAAALSAMGAATDGTVTVSNAVAISGTAAEVTAALVTEATKVAAATAVVTISDAAATPLAAADLSAMGAATAGTVTVSNAVAISGTAAEVTAALVTTATKVAAATAAVTISDAAATAMTAAALSAMGGATTGTVTVTNAVAISGTTAELLAALVTEGTKVVAANASITFTDAPSLTQFAAIDAATAGTLTYTSIADTLSALLADAALTTAAVAYNKPMTVTDTGTLQAVHLSTLSANSNQAVTATEASTLSGTAAQLKAVVNDAGIATASNYNAVVTGSIGVSDISAIDNDTTGSVTLANVTDTLSAIQTYNGASAANAAILQNATGVITANGDLNPDSFDFSAVLKGMTINGLAGADALTGTNFNDVITGGADADSLLGKGGADTFVFAQGEAPVAFVNGGTFEKINDFSAASDKIDLLVAPLLGVAESKVASLGGFPVTVSIDAAGKLTLAGDGVGDLLLTDFLSAVRGVVNGAGEIGFFEFDFGSGNSTFLYQENGASANDLLIALLGTTGIVDFSTTFGDANTLFIA